MIEILAAVGGVGTAGALVAVIVLAFKLDSARKEQIAAGDMIDKEREQHSKTRGELDVETSAHQATNKKLTAESLARAKAEARLNEVVRETRDFYVGRLKKSGVADAIRIIDDLLSAPLPVGMSEEVPAGDPGTTEDDLLRPAGMPSSG